MSMVKNWYRKQESCEERLSKETKVRKMCFLFVHVLTSVVGGPVSTHPPYIHQAVMH